MNKNSISAKGDINAQNLVGGNMINSAHAAVQNLQQNDKSTAQVLQKVLDMLAASPVEVGKADVADAVKTVAESPSVAAKQTLIERVKSFGIAAAAAGSAIAGVDKVVEAIASLNI